MNQIMPFAFGDNLVRTILDENHEPWFVAKDVCKCLELTNTSQTLSYLDDDEKGITTNDTPGGQQEMSIVSEAGLYSLILRSRKPQAKAFKRWITHEVLPALRRTGSYAINQDLSPDAMLDDLMPNLTNKERLLCLRMATQLLLAGKSVAELRSVFLQLCCLLRPAPQQMDLSDTNDLGDLLRTFIDQCLEEERGRRLKGREFYEAFCHWCANNGHTGTYSIRAVSGAIQRMGLLRLQQVRPCIVYADVRLRPGI